MSDLDNNEEVGIYFTEWMRNNFNEIDLQTLHLRGSSGRFKPESESELDQCREATAKGATETLLIKGTWVAVSDRRGTHSNYSDELIKLSQHDGLLHKLLKMAAPHDFIIRALLDRHKKMCKDMSNRPPFFKIKK